MILYNFDVALGNAQEVVLSNSQLQSKLVKYTVTRIVVRLRKSQRLVST